MHHSVIAARCRLALLLPAVPAILLAVSVPAWAAANTAIDGGDTAWVLIASALVLFMTLPGLGLFYGGLVRARNLLSVLMHCFAICSVVSVIWLLYGYSLAFGNGGALLGGLGKCFFSGVAHAIHPPHIPEYVFAL